MKLKRSLNKKLVIYSIAVAMVLSVIPILPTASAADLYVPGGYATIQAAIDAANPAGGDTIYVAAGTYSESAHNWVDIDVYKSVSIIGAGSSQTIVELHERNNPAGAHMDGVSISASDVLIQGITFTKQPTSPYASGFNIRAGINVHTPPPGNIFNNIILQDVVSEYSYSSNVIFDGAYTYNNVQLIDCNIHHSYTERCFYQSPNTIINDLTITNSHFDNAGYGIPTSGDPIGFNLQGTTTNLQITGGSFNDDPNGGIGIRRTTNAVIQGVSAVHSGYHASGTRSGIGIWEDMSSTSNVQIINPTVTNSGGRGIMFGTWGKTVQDITVTGGTISGSGNIGCMLYTGGTGGLVTGVTLDGVTITNSGSHNFLAQEDDSSGDCTCSNVIITHCTITNSPGKGVYYYGMNVAGSAVNYNNIENNIAGVFNVAGTGILDATCNWWGDASGPGLVAYGSGDTVSTNVLYCPWLDASYPGGNCIDYVCKNQDTGEEFCCIQCAIDFASPCDTIEVYTGTHVEQLLINKDLTLLGQPGAILQAPATLNGYTIPESTATIYPIIFGYGGTMTGNSVSGTATISVEIRGFEIDGRDNPNSYERHTGILYRNIKPGCCLSRIDYNTIYGMGTNGQQTFSILIYGDSDVLIDYNTVSEFSRGGIVANGDAGSLLDPVVVIDHNTVIGPYDPMGTQTWASNGIQIAYGGSGTISYNEVSACGWPGTEWAGTGIIVGDTSDVDITNNYVHDCEQAINVGDFPSSWGYPWNVDTASNIQVLYNLIQYNEWGISVFNDITNVLIQCNQILDTLYDGIDVYNYDYGGDNSPTNIEIHYNEIVGNGPDGLWVGATVTQIVDAECNWWGSHSGPGGDGPGSGDTVVGNADWDPWIFVVADAGGPYNGQTITFDSSGTQAGACGTISYLWDFGDGQTSTEANPTHTYNMVGTYTVTLIVTITTPCGFTYTDTDYTSARFFGGSDTEPPTTILVYPKGGETLSGTVTVQWFVHDSQDQFDHDIPVKLYYVDTSNHQYLITSVLQDRLVSDYEFAWSTTSVPDGTYRLALTATDSDNNVGHDESKAFLIQNHNAPPTNDPPNTPSRPSGSTEGKVGVEYTYTSITSDPDGDQIWLLFDWGDGTNSGWLGPYNSGDICEATHTWAEKNTYNVKVKAKDIYGKESSWSEPLPITMPYSYKPILQFLESLLERFPNAFPVLRHLLGY